MTKRRVFDDIRLKWKGNEYTIPSNRVLGAIMRIEQVVSIDDLFSALPQAAGGVKTTIKLGALSCAFATALRYAGAEVEDEEVYASIFGSNPQDAASSMLGAVQGLLSMMIPQSAVEAAEKEAKEAAEKGNSTGVSGKDKDARNSSRKRSRSLLPKGD